MTNKPIPAPPPPPPSRVCYTSICGELWFKSMEECDTYFAEPFWKRFLGLTAYDRRLSGVA